MLQKGNVVLTNFKRKGVRPVIILNYDEQVTVIPLTTKEDAVPTHTHVEITTKNSDIKKDSLAMCEKISKIDKKYLENSEVLFTISDSLIAVIEKVISKL